MVTTKELLKGGGMGEVTTGLSTMSSNGYMSAYKGTWLDPPSTQYKLAASTTQLIHPPGEYTLQHPFSFNQYCSHQGSTISSLEAMVVAMTNQPPLPLILLLPHLKFNQPLPIAGITQLALTRPYCAGLTPLPSALWPHCQAWDRLQLWWPLNSQSSCRGKTEVSEMDLERILDVIAVSWAKGTKEVYGTGLLVYHVFYDSQKVPKEERGPASPILVIAFISSCAGSYVGNILANYVFAIQAWHILHGLPWNMDDLQVKVALTGVTALALLTSKHLKRALVTIELMECIFCMLDLSNPLDVAVASCFTMTFYLVLHTGEWSQTACQTFWYLCQERLKWLGSHSIPPTKDEVCIGRVHQKWKMFSGHAKKASQILKLYLRIIYKSTVHLLRGIYSHTNTTEDSNH